MTDDDNNDMFWFFIITWILIIVLNCVSAGAIQSLMKELSSK